MARPPGVRVVAGAARGRRLVVPRGDAVRPTTGRVKEAVFSALDARDALAGASVLDLYAGSGSLAVEALSRGARAAVLVERDRAALDAIRTNLATVGFEDRARVVARDVAAFVAGPPPVEAPFGVVLLDPPYDSGPEAIAAVLAALGTPGWLEPGAVVVLEQRSARHAPEPDAPGLVVVWSRTFGDTLVTFYQQ